MSHQISDFEVFFFSASSFYPGRHHDADIPTQNSDNEDVTDAGDTEVESVGDWLTDPEVPEPIDMEPARRTSSKMLETTLVEVSMSILFLLLWLTSFFSIQSGRGLLLRAQLQPALVASQQAMTWPYPTRETMAVILTSM